MFLHKRVSALDNYVKNLDNYLIGSDGLRYYTKIDINGNIIVFRIDLPGQCAIKLPTNGFYLVSRDGLHGLINNNGGTLK